VLDAGTLIDANVSGVTLLFDTSTNTIALGGTMEATNGGILSTRRLPRTDIATACTTRPLSVSDLSREP